jgi:hypothetical protein
MSGLDGYSGQYGGGMYGGMGGMMPGYGGGMMPGMGYGGMMPGMGYGGMMPYGGVSSRPLTTWRLHSNIAAEANACEMSCLDICNLRRGCGSDHDSLTPTNPLVTVSATNSF